MKSLVCLCLLALFTPQCASAPPNLSPPGSRAYHTLQVVKGLDLIRDTAIHANAELPPLIDDATTAKIVRYHQSALNVIETSPTGWIPAVTTGLDEVIKDLPPSRRPLLAPYVALVKQLIQEAPK